MADGGVKGAARWVGCVALMVGGPVICALWVVESHFVPAADTIIANQISLSVASALSVIGVHFLPLGWKARLLVAIPIVPTAAYLSALTLFVADCSWFSNCAQ